MQDRRMIRIERQLGSTLPTLSAAADEASSLLKQDLADDLWDLVLRAKAIYAGIGDRGQVYRRPSTPVRN